MRIMIIMIILIMMVMMIMMMIMTIDDDDDNNDIINYDDGDDDGDGCGEEYFDTLSQIFVAFAQFCLQSFQLFSTAFVLQCC